MKREEELTAALRLIAAPRDCGCSPVCQCNSESALRIEVDNLKDIAQAALLPTPKPEPVGWETEAEWQLEMRCFNITEATPFAEVSKLINDLWQQYCLAAEPKPEATEVFADRHNDETGECEAVDLEPEMVRKLRDRIEATEGVDRHVHHSKPVVSQNTQIVGDNATEGGAWDGQSVEALIDQYAHGAYIGQVSKPTISVYRQHFKEFAEKLSSLQAAERPCTCHPDDNPPIPCARKFAYSECVTEGGAHEKGIEAAAESLVYTQDATFEIMARGCIDAYRAALTAKQTDRREGE